MSEIQNLIWDHKYAPKTVEDTILPKKQKETIKAMIAAGKIPNMLFHGTSGIGKTTLARAIAYETDADFHVVNASMDGNMDNLRTNITSFVSSVSFTDSKKIVLLDEADHLTSATQPALRGFIDEFSCNATFILTCNYPNRLIEPLVKRLDSVQFIFPKEEKQAASIAMLKRCCMILDAEGVTYDKKVVAALVTKNFPCFRQTLIQLQRYSSSGEIDSGILAESSDGALTALVDLIKAKDFGKCRQWVANNQMDAQSFYRGLYDRMLPLLVPASVPQIILIIADSADSARECIDSEINQIAALIKIMGTAAFK